MLIYNFGFKVGCVLPTLFLAIGLLSAGACNQKSGGRDATGTNSSAGGADDPNSPDSTDPDADTGKGTADSIVFEALEVATLFTKEAAENTCVSFVVKASSGGSPAADVKIAVSVQASTGMVDKGTLTPEEGVTDATGDFTGNYCSGENEGRVILLAKYGSLQVNSSKVTVTKKPIYKFTYVRSDVDPLLTPSDSSGSSSVIFLNLIDSGPQDCTNVYFKLTKSEAPVIGETITFNTQVDFPKGSKLGKRDETLKTLTDAITNKKYAVYSSISSGAGEFAVPVCAGVSLGTILISGTYVDDEGRGYTVQSPVVRITAGLTNYINMSLTFDPVNARTLRGYFNTNSSYQLPVSAQLGARQDGSPITDYPVGIATEVGKVRIENGGIPDSDSGAVKFTLQSLHLVDNYPYQVNRYAGYPEAQTRCEPSSLATWGAAQSLTEVKYSDLRKNWRSTMVYTVRGQEHFHDANRNGIYDVGGDGFWDKNQNGIYDSGDALTYDAGSDGIFDANSEWFIDLPTPFVDADENGVYSASVDQLIGDEYQAPNGKRDADALLWKYEYFPISMGPSAYGLKHYRIQTADYTLPDNPVTMPWGTSYQVFGVLPINASKLWTTADYAPAATYRSAAFVHDLCGNLLPGGTELSLSFEASSDPAWGARVPTGHFYIQPGDQYLEPTRHLLGNASGGSSATINFNASDHPVASAGYPVISSIEIPECTNPCTGVVNTANPGISCDGWSGIAYYSVKEPGLEGATSGSGLTFESSLFFPAISDQCNCLSTATEVQGVCTCPGTTTYDTATGTCH